MKINPYIFRSYDIRGIYKKDFDEETFQKIGFVLGKKKEKFLVGNDIRKSGKNLALALISGIKISGAKAIYVGTSSFGLTLFSGLKSKADKTLWVSASHLPGEWNGLKPYFGDGEPFSPKDIEKLKREVLKIEKKKLKKVKLKLKRISFKKEYFKFLIDKFPILKNNNLKIVLDCGNGSMSLVAPELFRKFGFKVIELFCKPDPRFPNRPSEPTLEATKFLREKVKKEKADFGVAFDGDGDRGVIIDDKGKYLDGNLVGIILGKDILPFSKNKKVVKTVSCSMAVEEELKKFGAKFFEVPVGHSYVISACKRKKAILGIEESSHIVIPEYFLFDDAILIPLKIAEILIKQKKKLSQIVKEIKKYPFEEIVFDCPDEIKFQVIDDLAKKFKKIYKRINTLDGLKINFDFGWILIRASATSPKIRLYVETKNKKRFKYLKEKFSKILKKCIRQ
jgi:phosphomannomutase